MRRNRSVFVALLSSFVALSSTARAQDSCEWDSVNGNVSGFCDGVIASDFEADDFEVGTIDDDHVIEDTWTRSPGREDGAECADKYVNLINMRDPAPVCTVDAADQANDWMDEEFAQEWDIFQESLVNDRFLQARAESPDFLDVTIPTDAVGSGVWYPAAQGGGPFDGVQPPVERTDGTVVGTDPVNPANGEFTYTHTDLSFPGFGIPFELTRTYRSRVDYDGPLGHGWDHTYNQRLIEEDGGGCAGAMRWMNGRAATIRFEESNRVETPIPGGTAIEVSYASPPGVRESLTASGSSRVVPLPNGGTTNVVTLSWTLRHPDGITATFSSSGLLERVEDPNHVGLTIEWEPAPDPQDARVVRVIDSVGRAIEFHYATNGRLSGVAEPTSGLEASYLVDGLGQLHTAVDAHGVTEIYDYDYDASRPEARPQYLPEPALRQACEQACAPTGAGCGAGGACDDAAADGRAACLSGCAACQPDCEAGCTDACESACRAGDASNPGCDALCDDECAIQAPMICDDIWDEVAQAFCWDCGDRCTEMAEQRCADIVCGAREAAGEVAPGTCSVTYDVDKLDGLEEIFSNLEALIGDGLSCATWIVSFGSAGDCDFDEPSDAFAEVCRRNVRDCCSSGADCSTESCNVNYSCYTECEAGFYGNGSPAASGAASCPFTPAGDGCLALAEVQCLDLCDEDCVEDCAAPCMAAGPDGCTAVCEDACGFDDCTAWCDTVDYLAICQSGCEDGCVTSGHEPGADFAGGPKYGYLRDLNHNLISITDGNGNTFLRLTYGPDLTQPSFDAVISQENGDDLVTLTYRDLTAEARGDILPPATGGEVVSRDEFNTVEICPTPCARADQMVVPVEYVPLPGGTLVVLETAPLQAGGFLVFNRVQILCVDGIPA